MKNPKNALKSTLLTGSILAGALTGLASPMNAESLFKYNSLGSGAEIRAELLDENLAAKLAESECGEKGKTTKTKTGNSKAAGEAKCGEGKCGEAKKDSTSKAKAGEAKCGEKNQAAGSKAGEKKK